MTTLYDFALKIEASGATKAVKPSLETWNVNELLCMFGVFILR